MRNWNKCAAALVFGASFGWMGHVKAGEPTRAAGPEAAAPTRYDGQMVVRLEAKNQRDYLTVERIAEGIWNCRPGVGVLHVQVTPEQRAALEAAGMATEVIIPDVQALIDAERAQIERARSQRDASWFATYHNLTEFNQRLDTLQALRPDLASTFSIGNSLQSRAIRGIRFTGPDQPGNPRAGRPALLVNGGQHAREWVNPATTIYVADKMIESYATDSRIRNLVDRVEIVVIPIVNPDGYEYTWAGTRLWRKNRRANGDGTFGVDLNRNWGFGWGGEGSSATPSSETYRGTSAFSEPETAVLRDFYVANPSIRASIDFHSYSQLVLSPWGWTSALPSDAGLFDELNARMVEGIHGVHGMDYIGGPAYSTIYPAAGVIDDWAYGDRGVLAWGLELRDQGQTGFVLPAEQILPTAEEAFEGVMRLGEYLTEPLRIFSAAKRPEFVETATPTTLVAGVGSNALTLDPASPVLRYREGGFGVWQSVAMTPTTPGFYSASVPGQSVGTRIEYYFQASTTGGLVVTYPAGGAGSAFVFTAATTSVPFADDMEVDRGWTRGAPGDAATTGLWERADPNATTYQPADDASAVGTLCYVTDGRSGTGDGAFDVDGGRTTIVSPMFSARPPEGMKTLKAVLDYAVWWGSSTSGNTNPDVLEITASNDDGATWTILDRRIHQALIWDRESWVLDTFLPLTTRMRLRVSVTDGGAGSVVEAAFDDVKFTLTYTVRTADVDDGSATGVPDGGVTIDDLLYYLAIFEQGAIEADFTNDDGVTIDDLLLYLEKFQQG